MIFIKADQIIHDLDFFLVKNVDPFRKFFGARLRSSNYYITGHHYRNKLTEPPQAWNYLKQCTIIFFNVVPSH